MGFIRHVAYKEGFRERVSCHLRDFGPLDIRRCTDPQSSAEFYSCLSLLSSKNIPVPIKFLKKAIKLEMCLAEAPTARALATHQTTLFVPVNKQYTNLETSHMETSHEPGLKYVNSSQPHLLHSSCQCQSATTSQIPPVTYAAPLWIGVAWPKSCCV